MRTGWRLFSGGLGATWLLLVASAVSSAVVHRDEPGLARVGEYAFLYFWGPAFAYLMAAAVGAYVIGGRFPWVRRALAILVLVVLLALAALALVDAVAG
ncbi:hypothetical protein Q760_13565 [Cellulomonas cellasea DSM 20118]|uniref:Uncharacterized protein n=2 Tax=Cellulomonas cellasea TaxID=43670 RepID=A0A0A0BCY4_9CELL|nr:hypothetical protein Q760_13565 [Cellulomonas cellasea DSM 20118]